MTDDPAAPDAQQMIVIRDRRQPLQFSIHNAVVDDWVPIIGPVGLSVYALYVRMAHHTDERCWPGYTLICSHLGIGHSTLSDINKLLEWCGLIYVQPGDRTTPNDYYILDIPQVTNERIEHIRHQAQAILPPESKFLATVLKRLENWQPISELWARHSKPPLTIIRPGQPTLPGIDDPEGTPPAEQGTPPAEHPTPHAEHLTPPAEQGVRPQECNNPKQQSETTIRKNSKHQHSAPVDVDAALRILEDQGIVDPAKTKIANSCSPTLIRAWTLYIETLDLRNPPGFLVTQLTGRAQPPGPYLEIANIPADAWTWLETHAEARRWAGDWPDDPPVPDALAELWFRTLHHPEPTDSGCSSSDIVVNR